MDAAQMQQFVEALIAAAAASTTAANAVAQQNAAAAATFALLPGASNTNSLDWTKAEAMKLFNKAVASLDSKFSLIEDTLRTFIEQVRERARIYNWDTLLTVADTGGTDRNILDNYGMLTIENCQAHANNHVGVKAGSALCTRHSRSQDAHSSGLDDALSVPLELVDRYRQISDVGRQRQVLRQRSSIRCMFPKSDHRSIIDRHQRQD